MPDKKIFIIKLKNLLNSHKFHLTIIILVLTELFLILSKNIIFEIKEFVNINFNSTSNSTKNYNKDFYLACSIITKLSITILGIFLVEVIMKLLLIPKIFIKHKLEILDAFVIIISFGLNLFLILKDEKTEPFVGLYMLIR
jgi:hypothetical protein